jgi:RNA polymerase sigma-70 factor (ECF subfamily)
MMWLAAKGIKAVQRIICNMNANSEDRSGDLVARWRQGDQQAAAQLFHRYAERLIVLARSHLTPKLAQRVDPEDVVQSVYRSFFAETRAGRYEFDRGGDLWHLLVAITHHKLYDQVKHNTRQKRAVAREQNLGKNGSFYGLETTLLAREPTPLEAAALSDTIEQLMRHLKPMHRNVFELRLKGYSTDEIAAELQFSERMVRYVLEWIEQELRRP